MLTNSPQIGDCLNKLALVVFGVALVLGVSDLLVVTLTVLLLIFAGILFGVFLSGIGRWVSARTSIPYLAAYTITIVVLVAAFSALLYYAGSHIAEQTERLSHELRSAGNQMIDRLEQYDWMPTRERLSSMAANGGRRLLPQVSNAVQAFTSGLTAALVVFFVGAYVAFDPRLYADGLLKLFPQDCKQSAKEVLIQLRTALGRWIVGRLISMSLIGITTAIALTLLSVPLAIPLGVLAALLTFIPNVGPILAAVPQAMLALNVGVETVLWVLLFNVTLQGVESYLITPVVQRYVVTLPPALTIAVQLLFGVTIGVVGVMMAAPLTVSAMVTVQYYLSARGKSSESASE